MPRKLSWVNLPDDELLKLRFRDLGITIRDTWLEGCLADLYEELDRRRIRVKPHVWLSDEWFSPDTTAGIAIPFYLAHPRLMRLQRSMIIDVEGGTVQDCKRFLRHETGHVIQHVYGLSRRRRWSALFGRSSTRYPRHYRPNPASRNFVQYLPLWYAQSHPDEDFAETFAVWLSSRSDWRRRYANWPALRKLEYVDELMGELTEEKPQRLPRLQVDPVSRLSETLGEHYEKKLAKYSMDAPKTYDRDLLRIFSDSPRHNNSQAAASFLRRNRVKVRQTVSKWTGEMQLTLDTVIDEMIARCRELKLRAVGSERQLRTEFTVMLTSQTVHSHYSQSRRRWFAL